MGHTFSQIYLHIIFSTKNRQPTLRCEIHDDLIRYINGIGRNINVEIVKVNCVRDHVHMLVKLRPTHAPSDIVSKIKANTSRWIHNTYSDMGDFAWQSGYGAFSVSVSVVPDVIVYIQNQTEHHRHVPFAEEYKQFLERHGVDYDPERYLD